MAWERGGRRPLVALVLFLAMSSRVKADNMEVKRLQSTDGAQLSIYCATTNGVIPEETTDHYELIFINPQNDEVTLTSTSEVLDNPQVFDLDLQGLYGSQTVFVLTLKDSQSDKASIDMTFSLEDMSSVKATWVGTKEQGKPGSVLRLHGHGSDVLVCPAGEDKTGCLAFPSDANYREASDLSGASALVCARMEEDPTVPFCLAVADVTTSPAISYHSEIRLSYQEDQTAAPEGTLSVAMGIDSGDKRDLLYWADGNLYVCAGTSSCKIEAYPSSSDQYEVFFVDYQEVDGEVSKASTVIPFIDFVVVGTVIGPDALEVRWKTNSHLQYKLSLTDNNGNDIETNPPPPFTSLVVHCASQEDCFGYFLELPAGDYKVMVRPWNGVDQIMSNSVLSSQQTIIQKSENKISDLEIQDVHFGWSSDGSKAFASACFTNKGGTPRSLRQFELVIADLKGHSIRSRGATQKADGAICFVGVTLLSDELIPGKVVAIVIERDFDGLSVVASASTEAFFKRTFDLTITQFEIVDETTKEFSIRYTGVSATVSGGELSAIKLEPEPVTEMDLALTGVSDTGANFVGTDLLMTWLQGQEPLKWVLRLTTEVGTMFGEVEFLFPVISNFPKCDPGYLVGKQQMVRLDCNEQSLETDAILVGGDDLAIQASTGVKGVNYHLLNQPATSAAHIQLCRKAEDNPDVEICTRRSELKDATANAAAMTAIQVEYEATISVEQTPSDKKALDSLVYYYHNDPDSTTIKSCREPDVQNCLVPEYIGVEELEVLVVYVDDTKGKPVESEQRTVYGLELRGAQISDSLSEIAIKKMPDRNAYRVIVLETSQGTGVEAREPILNVKVTCENPLCYAYFSHLTAGVKYKATVSPYEDKEGTGNLDLMNQIVSLEMSTTQYRGKRGAANPKELILKRINRVKADTTKFSTDITVSNGADAIDGIASVTLIATHDNGDGTEEEYVAISQDVDSGTISPNADQVYHFDINPADTILSPKTTLILIAKDAENVPLALAEATVELQTINPTMSWVGGEDTAPLRVSTDQKLEINEIEFDAGTSYSLDFDAAAAASPVEVCVTLENAAPAGGTVRQCDLTQSIQNVEHTKVEKIELQSEEGGKSDMTVWSTFKAMEAVLYNEEDTGIVLATFSCNTANVCTSDISSQIPGLEQVFKVLVVGVNETDVPWADVVDFENFQTRVQRISDSDVEVRWEASEMLDFNVHLENNNQDGFAIVPVQCGGADLRNCKAYFTKLEADTPYKAGVMKDNTVVSISVPTTAGTTPPLSISRLTKVSKHPAQMKLTFSAEVEVAGIEYVEYVVIDPPVDNTAMQHIIFKDTNEIINVGENEISFDEAELPDSGEGATVLVIVHGPDGAASDALAAGKVVGTFKAINPTMSWVGGEDAPPLRVSTDQKLEINGIGFDNGTSYSLDFDAAAAASPVEVCVTLENAAPAGGTVRQCDLTQSIQSVGELTIDKIELNYDDGKNFMTVSSTFAGMEAVLYNAGGSGIMPMTYSCVAEDTKTCSSVDIIDHISSLEPAFKVLVVGVEAETVTGAKVADFEDFKVRVQRFSDAGDLEVRWRASSDQSFKVHLDNEVPDGFTSVSLQCGGAGQAENRACKAYFTKLKPDTTYKVQLEKDNTVVSATVPATPGHSTAIHITQIAKASLDPLQTQLTVTADTEVMGMEYVEYVMIDLPSGDESTQYIVFKDMHGVINVDNSITFDVEQVPNTGVEVTILFIVHRKDGVDSDALAAGKVALTFEEIKPKMNWVGGTSKPPLRIQTTQELEVNGIHVDKGTFYFLDFDGSVSAPEVCVTRETIVPAGGTVKQCDMTLTKGNVPDMDVNKIELNHEEDKSTMTVYSTFTNMEAVLYDADDRGKVSESFSCNTENVCSSDVTTTLSGLETAFKVLAVGVDGQSDVTGAKLVDFEDFQTRAQKFGDAGDVEVRWRTSTPQQFNVSLENDVDDGYTNVSVECGGAEKAGNRACKAYYTKLKPGKTYKAEVKKDIAVVSASVTSPSGSVQALSITRISEVSKAPRQTQLTITAEEEVTGIEYLEYVMIDPPEGGEATEHIAINDTTDTIGVGNTTVTFSETDEPIMYEEETLLVLAHGPDTNILASGKVLMYFADLEPPKMTKVGSEELQSLKVETSDLDAKVNGELCRAKSVCYFLESEILEPPEVCRGGEPFVEQCDMTGSYILPKNLINPMVDLKYSGIPQEELTVTAEFDAASVSMEAMIYSDDGIDTSTPLTCNIKGKECVFTVVPPRPLFKILLMALNHQADVVESHATKFEDFQTRAEQVMDGTVEVSWKASQTMVYAIEIRPPPETSYSKTTVTCGGENPEDSKNCMAYFMGLNPGEGYTVYVTKEVDGSQSVSAFVQLETRDFSSPITITTVKKNADKRPSLSVCFKDELLAEGKSSEGVTGTRNLKYSLAVVNPLGQQLHSTLDLSSLSSHSNLEDDLCFSALSLGLDFDVRQKVWVFVKREGKSDGRVGAAGDVEVSLLAEIAEVSEVKAKATGFDKILVTWQKPEDEDDVSSYVITWTKASPSSKASLTDRSIQPRPRQPLPLIAQGFRESEQEQRVVPASYPSAEVLHLDPSQVYEVCVSAVRRGVEGGRMCDVNDLGKYDPVQSPTDLVFEDDLLKWKEVTSASGYLVEWRPRQEGVYSGGQAEVRTPSWHAGSLSPGRWVVSVRATTDTSASKPESAEYLRNGIEIVSAVQSKNNQLVLQWREEPEPPCAESTCNYTITTSRNKGPTWHSCSGLKDGCEKAVRVEGGSQVEVILERGGLRTSVKERVYRFPEVSGLSQRFAPGDKEVTMSWAEVEEAKLYNVTLYTDSTLSSIRFTAMINKESLNLRENNVTGNVLVIQPCADKDHCGNCQNITLMAIADSPSSNTPVVAASVVGGILLVVSVVFLVVVVKTIMKRREDEDTSPLEEVGGVPPMSAQQSAHSVAHRVIPLSTLSLQENKQE
ncbi:uncharacterized protein LOC122249732 isoform X2 [Penaeus japonicus]|uniref:uncharacterized protein LOC122249732 isoform X2 n=1 Tax=Penaeus japonicus TaxID=27405 RepID=UPI001C70CBB7|nr:uncharacterized protein LOC122249732 isoform X2 [Penaeus japonicus]